MQRFRTMSTTGKISVGVLADEIWEALQPIEPLGTPLDLLSASDAVEMVTLPDGKCKIIRGTLFSKDAVQIGEKLIEFESFSQCEFVKSLADLGVSGKISVPKEEDSCVRAMAGFAERTEAIQRRFTEEAAEHSSDDAMQKRICRELWKRLINHGRKPGSSMH